MLRLFPSSSLFYLQDLFFGKHCRAVGQLLKLDIKFRADRFCCPSAVGACLDDGRRPSRRIPPRVHTTCAHGSGVRVDCNRPVRPQRDSATVEEGDVRGLADRNNDGICRNLKLASLNWDWLSSPICSRITELVPHALKCGHRAVLQGDTLGRYELFQVVTFFEKIPQLFLFSGHLVLSPSVEDSDRPACESLCRSRCIDRCISATDHKHPGTQVRFFTPRYPLQEVKGGEDTFALYPFDRKLHVLLESTRYVNRIKAFACQFLRRCGDGMRKLDVDAHPSDPVDIFLHDSWRKPKCGSDGEHPACHVLGFVDRHQNAV